MKNNVTSLSASRHKIASAVFSAAWGGVLGLLLLDDHDRESCDRGVCYRGRSRRRGLAVRFDGTGIGVAVIDSGIAPHPDLNNASGGSRVVYSQSFVAGDTTSTSDKFGHGTHVAGLIGGTGKTPARQRLCRNLCRHGS
jgi:subtilisin family serine protease